MKDFSEYSTFTKLCIILLALAFLSALSGYFTGSNLPAAAPATPEEVSKNIKHNMEVCSKVNMYYLTKFTPLGYKAECMTKFEYDRRMRVIDMWVANSELKAIR
jgi:hypothetical protein